VTAYELLGFHDVVCRIWLPSGVSTKIMRDELRLQLDSAFVASIEPLEVGYEMRHFAFRTADGRPLEPDAEAIHELSDDELSEVEAHFDELPDGVKPPIAKRCAELGLITDFRPHASTAGIKFMIAVRASHQLTREPIRQLGHEITQILDAAGGMEQLSLYKTSGFAHYFVMGKVTPDEFDHLHTDLVAHLNSISIRDRFGTRTETHISAQRGFQIAQEGLSLFGRGEEIWLAEPSRPETSSGLPIGVDVVDPRVDAIGGRYVRHEQVGIGGSSEVFRVRDMLERVDRALKLFKADHADLARREANALRNYDHPSLAKYVEIGRHEDRFYIVMEYLEGRTVRELIETARDGLTVGTSVRILTKVLEALAYVHPDEEQIAELDSRAELTETELKDLLRLKHWGMIHRDIKPENVIITRDNEVKLVDFSIASPARSESHTHSGTIGYLAPDAGVGGWHPADDIFGCGVVLYECLTGALPFPQSKSGTIDAPVDILDRRQNVPHGLAHSVMRACSVWRQDRYQRAMDMLADIAPYGATT
jgi:tRNA A-37 threonylcarbamoyl transferase component Bud32